MSFGKYLIESIDYVDVEPEQLATLRQEIDRDAIVNQIKSKYLDKQQKQTKIVDSDFYINALGLDVKSKVVMKGSFVAEVTETDGYVYYKEVQFAYNVETKQLLEIDEVDNLRSDDWKVVQSEILKTGNKI